MQNQVSLQMPHSIIYCCSINSNTSYRADGKVRHQACPPGPWQHSYSKINLNLAVLLKIKLIFRNEDNNQGKYWTVLPGRGVRTGRKTPFGHLLLSWCSLLISHLLFSGKLFYSLDLPACFSEVPPT